MGSIDFATLKEWAKSSWDDQGDQREAFEDMFNFRTGHQWDENEESEMRDQSKAAVVFNRSAVIISSVVGSVNQQPD